MNEFLIFGRCRLCLSEKSRHYLLLDPIETGYAQVDIKTSEKQLPKLLNRNVLTCSGCAFANENKVNSKATDIYMHKEKRIFGEQDSAFQDLIKAKEHVVSATTNKCSSKLPTSTYDEISNANAPITKKKGSGRPPKRYDTQFQCDICSFATAYAKYFRTHMSEAHQEECARIFKCPHCTEAYVEERFLREHVKHIHYCVPRRPKLICAECGKGFPKQSHLKRHSYVHSPEEKPFLCEYCPMRFASRSSLTRHSDGAHNENKPHKCDKCGKAFGHIYGLKAHKVRVHWKEEH